jgi:hypothetical protein
MLAACGGQAPRSETPTRPEQLVLVVGESADSLGIEQARSTAGDAALVALHDGTTTWVDGWRVRALELLPSARVVVRRNGQLVVGQLVERLDRVALVSLGEAAPSLVPLADVIAVVRRSTALDAQPTTTTTTTTTTTPPVVPADPARVVAFDGPAVWAVARVLECDASTATVMLGEAPTPVPFARIAPLTVRAGDRVWADWQGTPYPATITETRAGMVHVQWEDESEQWMPADDIRRVLREPPRAGARGTRPSACLRQTAPVLVHLGRQRIVGVMQSCAEGRITIERPDGSVDQRPLGELSLLGLEAGDRVDAEWRGGGVYPATVMRVDEGIAHLRWEDSSEDDVSLGSIVTMLEPAGADRARTAPACP